MNGPSPDSHELVCPAGNLPSLKQAVDAGADAVYLGFRDATNARHFAGLNFDADTMRRASTMPAGAAARCSSPSTPIRNRPAGRRPGSGPWTAPPPCGWTR
jgi:hypothetical protein